ncbi:MAG TPA: hypothetical protein VHA54_11170 [Solirubrobacterales bacterium]|nr:hypothetical protein [Solirubrobacterales bacterium]
MPPTSPPSPPPSQPAAAAGAAAIQTSAVPGGDQCANCGAPLAVDQRYCLQCGQRRGDPRLPFMDAVVLMDAVRRTQQGPPPPPPTKKQRGGISPNAALITGIGVLLLALGLGVLIGRSGNNSTTASAPAAPQVITVNEGGGGSGGGEEGGGSSGGTSTGSTKAPKSKQEKAKKAKEAETQAGAEEVLKPAGDVKLPPAKVQPGEKCESGAAGCKNGEFTGEFFGE